MTQVYHILLMFATEQVKLTNLWDACKNEELVAGKSVALVKDVSNTDRYARLLMYVFVGDIFVNCEMLKLGLANTATYPQDVACADTLLSAGQDARQYKMGLWAGP